MTTKELKTSLNKALDDFRENLLMYDESSSEPATHADILELAKQTFYTLDEFQKQIITYLEKQ